MYIYTSKRKRRSFAAKLARRLGWEILTPTTGPQRGPGRRIYVLNWGCSQRPIWAQMDELNIQWLGNTPTMVGNIANKVRMFQRLTTADVPCLEWTTRQGRAQEWLDEGHPVYERHVLTGHSGAGIEVRRPGDELEDAPLYTKGITGNFREFRVHCMHGEVICVQQKRTMTEETLKARGLEVPDKEHRYAVRTYAHGWAFCVNNVDEVENLHARAEQACEAIPVSSCAVDILVTEDDQVIVIELNSAPALRSPTVFKAWAARIRRRGIKQYG